TYLRRMDDDEQHEEPYEEQYEEQYEELYEQFYEEQYEGEYQEHLRRNREGINHLTIHHAARRLKRIIPNVTEPEMIFDIPFSTFQLTMTLHPLRRLAFAAIHSCLASAYQMAERLHDADTLTPNMCLSHTTAPLHYTTTPDTSFKLSDHPAVQFVICGDLLWGSNQLNWGDVLDILFGLMLWLQKMKEGWERDVGFSFSVMEKDGVAMWPAYANNNDEDKYWFWAGERYRERDKGGKEDEKKKKKKKKKGRGELATGWLWGKGESVGDGRDTKPFVDAS
ncbi:MAG: hypothetical protein Q9169_007600, partial [Polycauliona sp. 2 TL-2023]